jgi:hypothetical protein
MLPDSTLPRTQQKTYIVLTMLPPIEKSHGELRSFVAKLTPKDGHTLSELESPLNFFMQQELLGGCAGVALVMRGNDAYVVHTLVRPVTLGNHSPGFMRKLLESFDGAIGGLVRVIWVRPLNRHLQRLFGWGDVNVKDVAAEVSLAAEDEDFYRIRMLVPEFAKYTDDEMSDSSLIMSRIVSGLLNPTPALQDCIHQWVAHEGPCMSEPCLSRHAKTWNKCSECTKIRCGFCVSLLKSRAAEENDVKEHVNALKDTVLYNFKLHPRLGRPFLVLDSAKMANAEKLEWLRAEFEPAGSVTTLEDLPAFAKMCKEFFHATTEKSQKPMIFALFEEFSGFPVGMEASLPPTLREELSEVWGHKLTFCRECGKQTGRDRFCGLACEVAFYKQQFRCPKCNHLQGARPTDTWTFPCLGDDSQFIEVTAHVCKGCGHQPEGISVADARAGTVNVHKTPLETVESLDHAWKRRRKSS